MPLLSEGPPRATATRTDPLDDDEPSRGRKILKRAAQVVLGMVGLAIGILAVLALREATLSTHQPVAPDSQIELIVETDVNGIESVLHTVEDATLAQITTCQLEVSSVLVGDLEPQGDDRFRAVLSPSMDDTNRRQFRGCIEDFIIDGVQIDVVSLEELL
jgi:hypothetical protein